MTILKDIYARLFLSSKESKQDTQIVALNNILAKLVANPTLESTQLSVLNQLQGLLTLAPSNATKANQDVQIAKSFDNQNSIWDTTALGLAHGSITSPDLNREIRNIGTLDLITAFKWLMGAFVSNGKSAEMFKYTKMTVDIEYVCASAAGGNAVLTFIAATKNPTTYKTPISCRTQNGNIVNSLSMVRNTRQFLIFDLVLAPFMYIEMLALPANFVINGTDLVRINNIMYHY